MLLGCGTRMMGGGATAALGGVAMLAAAGPFLAGLGLGAALVGGAVLARRAMRQRTAWRDDELGTASGAMAGTGDAGMAETPMMPDEGEPKPA
jgi:hypothetical protein